MELAIPSFEEIKKSREPVGYLSDDQVKYVEGKFDEALKDPTINSIEFCHDYFNSNQLLTLAHQIAEKGYKVENIMINNEIYSIVVLFTENE